MSNPSYIGIKRNNSYYYVYCHNGKSLSENGKTLYENYKTTEQVQELLEHGNMSYITTRPEEKQYYKFRGQKGYRGTYNVDRFHRPREADGGTPCYLWNGSEWLYSPEDDEIWVPLAAVFQKQLEWC